MEIFGTDDDGNEVYEIELDNGKITCSVLTYGCVIRKLIVPDRNGRPVDVVLGYDDLEQYKSLSGRLGAVIGRYANRIGGARFELNGKVYDLTKNRGEEHIHGGAKGFDKRNWHVDSFSDIHVKLSLDSADGEEGYPGNTHVSVTYTLLDDGLRIDYEAESDADTICNLTNHSYFNLNGNGDISDHEVTVLSDRYTPVNERSVPTGEIRDVSGRLDLRAGLKMGDVLVNGYDTNYLLSNPDICASCHSPYTGIRMDVSTDMPAMQFYTGNGLKSGTQGKNGRVFGRCAGLCFETQNCPDAPNHSEFPDSVLRAGDKYQHYTEFRFFAE